jgi:hypothetical protein
VRYRGVLTAIMLLVCSAKGFAQINTEIITGFVGLGRDKTNKVRDSCGPKGHQTTWTNQGC